MVRQPAWLWVEGEYVRLNSLAEMELACRLVCICHNGVDAPSEGETEDPGEAYMDESD